MAHKVCTKCQNKIPIACKTCKCGHKFPVRSNKVLQDTRGKSRLKPATNISERKKRLVRVRKVTSQYQASIPGKIRQIKTKSSVDATPKKRGRKPACIDQKPKKRRQYEKSAVVRAREAEAQKSATNNEEDNYSSMTAEKALQYSIILAEINRKYSFQTFKPL